MSDLFATAFGQSETDFTKEEEENVELKQLVTSTDVATAISDGIEVAFNDAQHPSTLAEAERNAHNMDAVGMERLFNMRFKQSSGYSNESISILAGVGVAAALIIIIGLLAKRFDWATYFLEKNAEKLERSKERIDSSVERYGENLDRDIKGATEDNEKQEALIAKIRRETDRVEQSTDTELAHAIIKGKIKFKDGNSVLRGSVKSFDAINKLIDKANNLISGFETVGKNFGHKDNDTESKMIKDFVDGVDDFYSKNGHYLKDVVNSDLIDGMKAIFDNDVKFVLPDHPDSQSISDTFRELGMVINREKTTLTSKREQIGVTTLELIKADTVDLNGIKDSIVIYKDVEKQSSDAASTIKKTTEKVEHLDKALQRAGAGLKVDEQHEYINSGKFKNAGTALKRLMESLNDLASVIQKSILVAETVRITSVKMYDSQQHAIKIEEAKNKMREENFNI